MSKKFREILAAAIDQHVAGRIDDAEAGYRAALKVEPNDPTALLWLGVIACQSQRYDEAQKLLTRSLRGDPRSSVAQLNLGLAHAGLGNSEAAQSAYRRAVALDPTNRDAYNNLGVLLESMKRPAEAIEPYRKAVELDPISPTFLSNLGNALRLSGRLDEAVETYRRSLELDPSALFALNNLGVAYYGLGRLAEACEVYRRVLEIDPSLTETRLNLAQALYERRLLQEAADEYHAVADRDPSVALAHIALGLLYAESALDQEAKPCFERALALDPGSAFTRYNYAVCLEALGDHAGAARERKRALALSRTLVEPFVGVKKRGELMQLAVAGAGNIPTKFLVDRHNYGRITFYPEDLPAEGAPDLPPHDVIFNVIADPDVAEHALLGAQAFLKAAGKPFLNDPAKVMRTKRHLIPELLAAIPNVVMPQTSPAKRADLIGDGSATLAGFGAFPFLVRPAGSHGGENLALIENAAAMQTYLAGLPDDDFYLTRYFDYRSADGLFRKYRIIFVDRKIYPLHLCIDDKWKVHYYTSMMFDHEWMRAEEAAFLEDIGAAFPPALQAAATAIAERLDLDYAGMDCSITRDGDLLVFEANANMLAHLNDPIEMFPYKHKYVPRMADAFHALVERKIQEG